jgi:hypothetical protein
VKLLAHVRADERTHDGTDLPISPPMAGGNAQAFRTSS